MTRYAEGLSDRAHAARLYHAGHRVQAKFYALRAAARLDLACDLREFSAGDVLRLIDAEIQRRIGAVDGLTTGDVRRRLEAI